MESSTEYRFFVDPFGTSYAAEIIATAVWEPGLAIPPGVRQADIRVVFCSAPVPDDLPGWLVVFATEPGLVDAAEVESVAARAWLRSPHHRPPGASASDYVTAGFQAFCPPHPPCPPGPQARTVLAAFSQRRGGLFAPLGEEGREGFDRWLRVAWRSPEHFARDVLAERMTEAGEHEALALTQFVEEAEVWPDADTVALAEQRRSLIERLTPLRYFADPVGWDAARAEAVVWRESYRLAYLDHFRRVARMATETLADLLPAVTAADVLQAFNQADRSGQSIGQDALDRLRRAVAQLGQIPATPDLDQPRTGGVTLGRIPGALAEARLAAAAVLAAVDVRRRRVMS